jgi:hypothetical protein
MWQKTDEKKRKQKEKCADRHSNLNPEKQPDFESVTLTKSSNNSSGARIQALFEYLHVSIVSCIFE